jgi:hypothetical protein
MPINIPCLAHSCVTLYTADVSWHVFQQAGSKDVRYFAFKLIHAPVGREQEAVVRYLNMTNGI